MMPLEKQVTSLELSKKLQKLGVKQESLFYWVRPNHLPQEYPFAIWFHEKLSTITGETANWDQISAFTVAELGAILPFGIVTVKNPNGLWSGEDYDADICPDLVIKDCTSEANLRAAMLIVLIEKGLVTP